jgi:hypothetical protein
MENLANSRMVLHEHAIQILVRSIANGAHGASAQELAVVVLAPRPERLLLQPLMAAMNAKEMQARAAPITINARQTVWLATGALAPRPAVAAYEPEQLLHPLPMAELHAQLYLKPAIPRHAAHPHGPAQRVVDILVDL